MFSDSSQPRQLTAVVRAGSSRSTSTPVPVPGAPSLEPIQTQGDADWDPTPGTVGCAIPAIGLRVGGAGTGGRNSYWESPARDVYRRKTHPACACSSFLGIPTARRHTVGNICIPGY
eukprot:641751-Rhodomonas_salina.1